MEESASQLSLLKYLVTNLQTIGKTESVGEELVINLLLKRVASYICIWSAKKHSSATHCLENSYL